MSDKEIRMHVLAVLVLLVAMVAIGMLSMVARQNWNSKVTAYPTKTETAIEDYARKLMGEMTIEQKVGQLFIAVDAEDLEAAAAEYHVGGVLLNPSHLENLTIDEVSAVLHGYDAAGETPMFFAVSEEGGAVNTVSVVPTLRARPFLSPRELMTTGNLKFVDSDAREKSDLLRHLGINLNLAPVCDVVTHEKALMYDRAAVGDAEDVGRYTETVIKAMNDRKMIGALKYFPGSGNLEAKEWTDILTDDRTYEELAAEAFPPYVRAMEAGARVVMMGNTIVTAVDDDKPAGLSRDVHKLLRRELGFEGVIIGSDLQALGMGRYGTPTELAVLALQAGSDMILGADYPEQIDGVLRAVKAGTVSVERIEESVLRILQLKIAYGIVS